MPTANKSAKATTQDRTAVIKEYGQQKTRQSAAASESKRQSEIAEVLTKARHPFGLPHPPFASRPFLSRFRHEILRSDFLKTIQKLSYLHTVH